ncbi:hypothetical protein EVAR_16156_1 [Eumeta japonica]|uniref:Uncharacterized protein n=1 Tax=Eumeta variegata TaxID=151549 RepID=A0A4C1WE97_EUMVA|nr:hypothetical protein EVAR_16156_1 [Eumeta japonica]
MVTVVVSKDEVLDKALIHPMKEYRDSPTERFQSADSGEAPAHMWAGRPRADGAIAGSSRPAPPGRAPLAAKAECCR